MVLGEVIPPSWGEIDRLYKVNKRPVLKAVQKLYVVERSEPKITLPEQDIVMTENGDLHIEYKGAGFLEIGTEYYNLKYTFKLQPQTVYGFKDENELSTGWYVAAGVGLILVGVLAGVYISRSTSFMGRRNLTLRDGRFGSFSF